MTPLPEDNENVARQLPPGGSPKIVDFGNSTPVHSSIFIPTDRDVDGLSMIRLRFRSKEWASHRREKPNVAFMLAIKKLSDLSSIAISAGFESFDFSPSPDALDREYGEPWAHFVASQINRRDYDNKIGEKAKIKTWAKLVCQAISIQEIISPPNQPLSSFEYRPCSD